MSTAHTPGPWLVKARLWQGGTTHVEGPGVFSIEDAATETVICDRRTPWPEQAAVMEANARLISAAPELLDALRDLHHMCELALAGKNGVQHSNLETRLGTFVHAEPLMKAAEASLATLKELTQ